MRPQGSKAVKQQGQKALTFQGLHDMSHPRALAEG
jgi:hypothetical protein